MYAIKAQLKILVPVFFCAMMLGSCSTFHAPAGWLPERKDVAKDIYGSWLYMEWSGSMQEENVTQGEFIGIYDTTIYLFDNTVLIRVPMDRVTFASLKIHDDDRTLFLIWSTLGTISTLTNGWLLGITAPLWIIAGIGVTSAETRSGLFTEENPRSGWWRTMTRYSRFPQGIPREVDLNKLKAKLYLRKSDQE